MLDENTSEEKENTLRRKGGKKTKKISLAKLAGRKSN
jgi:hypothetical protein